MMLGAEMAKNAVRALSDEFAKRILISTVTGGKTVQEISLEQAVPLSTCYRRARDLLDEGLLVVERLVVTGDGKRYSVYRSSFKTMEISSDLRTLSVTAELNEDVAGKFRDRWFCLSYPEKGN